MIRIPTTALAASLLLATGCHWCGKCNRHHEYAAFTVSGGAVTQAACNCGDATGMPGMQVSMMPQVGYPVMPESVPTVAPGVVYPAPSMQVVPPPLPTIPSKQMPIANYQPMPVAK